MQKIGKLLKPNFIQTECTVTCTTSSNFPPKSWKQYNNYKIYNWTYIKQTCKLFSI